MVAASSALTFVSHMLVLSASKRFVMDKGGMEIFELDRCLGICARSE